MKEEFSLRSGFKTFASLTGLFLALWVCLRLLFPLFSPFVLGAVLALAAEPMVLFLSRRLRLPRPVSAGIGVGMAFCFLAMGILLLLGFFVRELRTLAGALPQLEQAALEGIHTVQDWAMEQTRRLPENLGALLRENLTVLFSDGASFTARASGVLLSFAGNLLSRLPDSALGLGTGVISAFLISAKLPRIRRWILKRIPRERLRALSAAAGRIKSTILGWLTAQAKLMAVTAVLLALGFWLLRIKNGLLWALGVSLVDAFPILGTGTVLLPWSLFAFLQQDAPRAIGLLGLYATVTLTRSILEPKLVGRHLGLDPLAALMALYAGYRLLGLPGMILAPMLTVTALQLVPERH